jgi:hypothetical protein
VTYFHIFINKFITFVDLLINIWLSSCVACNILRCEGRVIRAQCPLPSPVSFRPKGVYNLFFGTLMPDRETSCWTPNGTLLWPELCNNEIPPDLCRMCLTVPHNTLIWGLFSPSFPRVSRIAFMDPSKVNEQEIRDQWKKIRDNL